MLKCERAFAIFRRQTVNCFMDFVNECMVFELWGPGLQSLCPLHTRIQLQ